MKLKIVIISLLCAAAISSWANSESKQPVSQKLMDLANDIDSEAAKEHYEYFLTIRNK